MSFRKNICTFVENNKEVYVAVVGRRLGNGALC